MLNDVVIEDLSLTESILNTIILTVLLVMVINVGYCGSIDNTVLTIHMSLTVYIYKIPLD